MQNKAIGYLFAEGVNQLRSSSIPSPFLPDLTIYLCRHGGASTSLTHTLSLALSSLNHNVSVIHWPYFDHKKIEADPFTYLWKKWSVTIGSNWWIPCILIHPLFIIHWSLSNYQFILFKKHVLLFMLQNSILKNGWKYPLRFFCLGTTWQLFAHFT